METMNILYVEDDEPSRFVMKFIVQSMGENAQIVMFENSQNFKEKLVDLHPEPDVILLDIQMKPINGFAMLDLLREDNRFQNKTIIALTASVMNEEIQQLKDAGFDGVIAKPIDMDLFPRMLQRILDKEKVWYVTT